MPKTGENTKNYFGYPHPAGSWAARTRYPRRDYLFIRTILTLCYRATAICQDNPVKRALEEKARAEAEQKAKLEAEEAECEREKAGANARKPIPTKPKPAASPAPEMDPAPEATIPIPRLRFPIASAIATATHSNCTERGGRALDLCIAVDVSESMSDEMGNLSRVGSQLQQRIEACHNESVNIFVLEYGQRSRGTFVPTWVNAHSLASYLRNYRWKKVGVEPKANAISACGRRLISDGRAGVKKEVLVLTDEGTDAVSTIPQYTRAELNARGIEVRVVDFRDY